MLRVVLAAAGTLAAGWLVAPWVDMAVRGTLDQRKLHALRREATEARGAAQGL